MQNFYFNFVLPFVALLKFTWGGRGSKNKTLYGLCEERACQNIDRYYYLEFKNTFVNANSCIL